MKYGPFVMIVTLALSTSISSAATYKFVGSKFVRVSGCLTTKDYITVTMKFAKPIAEGSCNSVNPKTITIGDGVNKASGSIAYFSGEIELCKFDQNGKPTKDIEYWGVGGNLVSKSGSSEFGLYLENDGSVLDSIQDAFANCLGMGSTGLPGKWTGQ